jgi:hypothetical protein
MARHTSTRRRGAPNFLATIAASVLSAGAYVADSGTAEAVQCDRTITANVVVLDNPTVFNRLGAQNPNWITYALLRDVVFQDRNAPGIPGVDPGANPLNGTPCTQTACTAGNVELRPDKRPRPLVVRSVAESCLTINFQNLLAPVANPNNAQQDNLINNDQVADRQAGFHAQGVELLNIGSDGSFVGTNTSSLVAPGGSISYNLYTPHEGTFTINSYGATIGSEASGGNLGIGMFGQLNVQPKGANLYRGQLTEEEMRLATTGTVLSDCAAAGVDQILGTVDDILPSPGETVGVTCNPGGQPIIDYEALYPNVEPWISEGKAGLPIINMLTAVNELVHSDINAIITGPEPDGSFPGSTYPLESVGKNNPALPQRLQPFREFSSVFHDEQTNSQVFPQWYGNPVLQYTLAGVKDQFMINYGSGGIGSEIIANRLHTGPMHDCTDCAYEEFFLASQTVGDPGMLVNFPANTGIEQCDPADIDGNGPNGVTCFRDPVNLANGPVAFPDPMTGVMVPVDNFALYQEDPSNVHHAYTGDSVKIRNIHAGAFEQHIFHLHNHQWLFNPNDDNANYLDAQEIMPGSGHTYELVYGGAGNRNKTAGDAIFHCHFYPHFAQGMWYHIRNHDVMETGTVLAVSGGTAAAPGIHAMPFDLRSGKPAAGARALPDGELPDGTPIPAIVPLPGKAMPQMPAAVSVAAVDRGSHSILGGRSGPDGIPDSSQAVVDRVSVAGVDGVPGTADDVSPGYPFWLAGNECGVPTTTDACPQGMVGQRMPTPPLDMLTEAGATANGYSPAQAGGWDGGLPRHALLGYVSGGLSADTNSRLDFRKVIELAMPVYFPETGTDLELVSMAYHAVRNRPSAANTLAGAVTTVADFVLNGAPPVPGGPYQDPCIDDIGTPFTGGPYSWFDGDGDSTTYSTSGDVTFDSENPRTYKIANVQIDAVFNKVGYHYPQERIIALWQDVEPTINKLRPPEPLVMRFNTLDCGKILHANLVPHEFELDDFQVRTPTDIIGQHIHLPKWDLTTGDGAANGWNYEDGALAPGIVQERIHAINEFNILTADCVADPLNCVVPAGTLPGQLAPIDLTGLAPVPTIDTGDPGSDVLPGTTHLTALPHPFFGVGVATQDHLGARTVIQRILVDPVVNVAGVDRGLGLTFSHDHYGPSTFQQIGLYSTILAEPAGSTWVHNESGVPLNTRDDGGPTTWQAAIITPEGSPVPDHREFYFEMSDFQHAYEAGTYVGANANGVPVLTTINQPDPFNATNADAPALNNTWQNTVNPPLKLKSVPFPDVVTAEGACPGPLGNADPNIKRPCAEAINISHSSMFVVNYRNEPVGLRVFDPNGVGPDGQNGTQAAGLGGDLAFAFQTRTDRAIPQLNTALGDMPYPVNRACAGNRGDGINCDRRAGDPITPIMRAYEGDNVKVKIQVGATEEQHQTTIHGMKWLSNGSGFGKSPNSGWRNFQSHGISEQFSLQIPINADKGQTGNQMDYLYAQDATRDGIWLGTWGLLRAYGNGQRDLFELPENPVRARRIVNQGQFVGVCPDLDQDAIADNLVAYDVTAVLANDVLPNLLGVTIPGNVGGDSDGDGIGDNVGGPLNTAGGTLVYNRRGTVVPDVVIPPEGGEPGATLLGGTGPLNDPTAMLYVRTADLEVTDPNDPGCFEIDPVTGLPVFNAGLLTCPHNLVAGAPVEPIVLRANAGNCIEVTLRNRLPAVAPDLAGWQDMMWLVKRNIQIDPVTGLPEMHFFNNNLVRPSSHVGLHPQLVEYDASRDDGLIVGRNSLASFPVAPGGVKTYRWYAGDIQHNVVAERRNRVDLEAVATPVEFGGTNLLSADRVKQPQKGLFGALVIEPAGAVVTEGTLAPDGQGSGAATRLTRAQVSVSSPVGGAGSGGDFREALAIGHKITNLRWKDGTAIANVNQAELGREGAEDSGHAGFNYAMEPSWFRFKLPPDVPFGNAGTPNSFGSVPNAHAMYANNLVTGEPNVIPAIAGVSAAGDPATPVFIAAANGATRMHLLNGASADRDGTFILHGHLWQRDPYVCPGQSDLGLIGRCDPNEPVPSQALGLNPQGKYMGSEEGMGHVYGHWPILFNAGGTDGITGDYLYRDYAPNGNRNGQFGILRVE